MYKKITLLLLFVSAMLSAQTKIALGEYWFNNNFNERYNITTPNASNLLYNAEIDVSTLADGLHTISFRFKDDSLRWSGTVTRFFVKKTEDEIVQVSPVTTIQRWFNSDLSTLTTQTPGNNQTINLDEDVNVYHLKPGLHTIHYRFKDNSGLWSAVVSRFFVVSSQAEENDLSTLTKMEYWMDNNVSNHQTILLDGVNQFNLTDSVETDSLPLGLHTIHCRFMDSNNNWSSVVSRFFVINSHIDEGNGLLVGMESWFDNEIEHAEYSDLEGVQSFNLVNEHSVDSLADGLHTIHCRFKDNRGNWSPALSRFFVKQGINSVDTGKIVAMRYWTHNNNVRTVHFPDTSSTLLFNDSLDLRLIPKGEHIVNMQFKDNNGLWSSAISDTVTKLSFPFAQLQFNQQYTCVGDSVLIRAILVDADSVRWNMGENISDTARSIHRSFDAEAAFDISISVTDTSEQITNTYALTKDFKVYPLPELSLPDSVAILNEEVKMVDAGNAARKYYWNNTLGSNLFEASEATLGLGEHSIPIRVEDEHGCISNDTLYVNVYTNVGSAALEQTQIKLYPNPIQSHFTIAWDADVAQNTNLALFDYSGKTVKIINHYQPSELIDVSALPAGNYVVRIQFANTFLSIPIIKQ